MIPATTRPTRTPQALPVTEPVIAPLRVLVVEDEPAIRRFVRDTLRQAGMRVSEASGVAAALTQAGDLQPELVVLDLGLEDGDGMQFIAEFRRWSNRPILVLSARQDEHDKVAALDAGADDFLTKPFAVNELLARLRALSRRIDRARGGESAQFRFGDVEVDLARHCVTRAGTAVRLTQREFALLAELLGHAGTVLTHRALLRAVWGPAHVEDSHYLRIYIGRLRQKLERDPALPAHLLTEIGIGYRFVP